MPMKPELYEPNQTRTGANLAKLPDLCYSTLPIDASQFIAIKRGESGYYLCKNVPPNMTLAEMNKGIEPAVVYAMETGSMFGWDVPGADLDVARADLARFPKLRAHYESMVSK